MRVVKFIATVALLLALFLAIAFPFDRVSLWAQLPPPNPLTAPRAVPSAPSQLPPPVPAEGLPSLAVVASPASPSPTPSVRAFNCSCFGPSTGTNWMGQVSASGFFAARQSATGACLSYMQRSPSPPGIPLPTTETQALPILSKGFEQGDLAGIPNLNLLSAEQLNACAQCTCD
jgi:hypothetical protein